MTTQGRNWLLREHGAHVVDVGTLLLLGGIAFAGSARHVLKLADEHGQRGLSGWLIAGSMEVLAAFAGWEMRRRKGWLRAVPGAVLVGAAGFIIAANLASAEASGWGMALAVTPPAVFLAVVLIAETRHLHRPRRKAPGAAAPSASKRGRGTPVVEAAGSPEPPPEKAPPQVTGTTAQRILAHLARGSATRKELVAATGAAEETVKTQLTRLKDAGRIEADPDRPRHWRLHVPLAVAR
jgi:hypothetical protein